MNPALIAALISAMGSIGGGLLSGDPKESQTQRQKRELVDDLLASLRGQGSFSDLFQTDEGAFQKSFVDPAKSMFSNQIAPQIQQSFISSGQQRGTGLDDTLSRAGVDLDQLLNKEFASFQQSALDRKSNVLSSILGLGEGVQPGFSTGEKLSQGAGGFLSSEGFGENLTNILKSFQNKGQSTQDQQVNRKGFTS